MSPRGSLVMFAMTAVEGLGGSMMKRYGSERVLTGACAMMPAATGAAGGGAAHAVAAPARLGVEAVTTAAAQPMFSYVQGWRVDRHPRALADVNGDGRDDVVRFGYSATTVRLS